MAAANAAMNAARAAEAEQYVAQDWRMLNDSLNAATAMKTEQDGKFALFRSYGSSKEMFVRVEGMANQVVTKAQAEKERVKNEVMAMIGQAQMMMDSTNAAFEKAPKGKDNKADLELIKNDLMGITAAFAEAQADFDGGRYLVAKGKFSSLMQKMQSIMGEIDMAVAKKKGK